MMVISDPAAEFIAAQKPTVTDFIFRVTGDRSRAGIIASEVCESVHRDLLSSWTERDIRIELFAYAYEVNLDAQRGIDKNFLESYYRNQFDEVVKISIYYPLENLLLEMGIIKALTALLIYRYEFNHLEVARILGKSMEDVEADVKAIAKHARAHPKIKMPEMINLPVYNFLTIPDYHPTAISHILVNMKSEEEPFDWRLPKIIALVLAGLIIGYAVYRMLR